jgi:hypothetical protein
MVVCKFSNSSATVGQNERRDTWPYLKYCDNSVVCGKYDIIIWEIFRILTPVSIITRVPAGRFWVRSQVFSSFFVISNQSSRYSMSWCAGWLTNVVRTAPARRSLSWIQSFLLDLWLVNEVSTLSLNLLTTQTMVTTGILPLQGKSPC